MTENLEPTGQEIPDPKHLLDLTLKPETNTEVLCVQIVDRFLIDSGFTDYFLFYEERRRLIDKLTILVKRFPGESIEGKTIIDLGCGNNGGTAENADFDCRNQPWFCRLLHHLGVNAMGIDIGTLEKEKFACRQIDLTKPDALRSIENEFADAVFADHLYTSEDLLYQKIRNPKLSIKDLRQQLFPQIQRILKRNGIYVENDDIKYDRYFVHNRYHLDHEQASIQEVNRLFREITEVKDHEKFYIALKISELIFPYLSREYNYSPDDDSRYLIEFHCAFVAEYIARVLPGLEFDHHSIVEYIPFICSVSRLHEPWISRFLEIIGARPLQVFLNHENTCPDNAYRWGVTPADNSVDIAISPLTDDFSAEAKKLYSGRVDAVLKNTGHHLVRETGSVKWLKKADKKP